MGTVRWSCGGLVGAHVRLVPLESVEGIVSSLENDKCSAMYEGPDNSRRMKQDLGSVKGSSSVAIMSKERLVCDSREVVPGWGMTHDNGDSSLPVLPDGRTRRRRKYERSPVGRRWRHD